MLSWACIIANLQNFHLIFSKSINCEFTLDLNDERNY